MAIDEIESQSVGSKDGALIDVEDPRCPIINRIIKKLERLDPPLTSKYCIYRVSRSLRKLNEDAYTPRVISIGPFHHGKSMEKHKEIYLHDFLKRAKLQKVSLEDLVTSIGEWEEEIRRCYAETIKLSSNDFIEMILLDGSFIIEYFLRSYFRSDIFFENDEVLHKPWLEVDIRSDLILLENQLPFFLLEKLYNRAFPIDHQRPSFLQIACHYFSYFNEQNKIQDPNVKHFTDLVRMFHLSSSTRRVVVKASDPPLPTTRSPPEEKQRNQFSYSATELHEAGVKFKVSSSKCLFDIQFTKGVLQIPHIRITDSTECLIRNLIALEQCHYPIETYICEYIDLMDTLINTAKDVELLVQNGIIFNWLGDNQAVATLFNKMCKEIVLTRDESYFMKLCNDLTVYCKIPWHKYEAILKRDYFSTPWRIASIVAAFILLVLTFMQTVNSFISL